MTQTVSLTWLGLTGAIRVVSDVTSGDRSSLGEDETLTVPLVLAWSSFEASQLMEPDGDLRRGPDVLDVEERA